MEFRLHHLGPLETLSTHDVIVGRLLILLIAMVPQRISSASDQTFSSPKSWCRAEVYGASISKDTISGITDRIVEEMQARTSRPLVPVYAAVFIDAIPVMAPSRLGPARSATTHFWAPKPSRIGAPPTGDAAVR